MRSSQVTRILPRVFNLLQGILNRQDYTHTLLQEIKSAMSDQTDQLNAGLDAVNATLQNVAAHQASAITDLQAEVAAGKTGPDLQPFIDRVAQINQDLSNIDLSAVAADPGPAVVTTAGSPPPVTPPVPPVATPPAPVATPDPTATVTDTTATDAAATAPAAPTTPAAGDVLPSGVDTSGGLNTQGGQGDSLAAGGGVNQQPTDPAVLADADTIAKPAPLEADGVTVSGSGLPTDNPASVNPGGSPAQGGGTADGASQNPNELDNPDPTMGGADRTPNAPNPDGSAGTPMTKNEQLNQPDADPSTAA